MNPKNIAAVTLNLVNAARASERMLHGEIPGATVYHHVLPAGDVVQFMADPSFLRILFLCQGEVRFSIGD